MSTLRRISTDELVVATADRPPATSSPLDHDRRRLHATPRFGRPPREVIGLIGVVVAFTAVAGLFALQQPPFYDADEKAHLAYAHEIADLRLPEVATVARPPLNAYQWRAELSAAQDSRYRRIWVANHPPLNYVLSAPLIWVAEATDRPDGGLLLLRLQNIALAAVGVVFTYLVGVEVTRRRRLGLVAAAIVALVPQGHTYFSRALNDGLAFAAATALVWAGLRVMRLGPRRDTLGWLSGTAVVATGARTATMLLSVGVVAAVVLHLVVTRRHTERAATRWAAAGRVGLVGLGPAALVWGWFYVRNARLYGDIGGSGYLLDRFGRERRGSVVDLVTWGHMWSRLYRRLTTTAPLDWHVPRFATLVAALAVAGLVVAVAVAAARRATTELRGIALCLMVVAVTALTVAQHLAGGGSVYSRYLFPALGVAAVLAAIGYDRLGPGVAPLALIAVMTVWLVTKIPRSVDVATLERPRDNGPPPLRLQVLPGGDGVRRLLAVLATGGGLVALGVLVTISGAAVRRRDPPVIAAR